MVSKHTLAYQNLKSYLVHHAADFELVKSLRTSGAIPPDSKRRLLHCISSRVVGQCLYACKEPMEREAGVQWLVDSKFYAAALQLSRVWATTFVPPSKEEAD